MKLPALSTLLSQAASKMVYLSERTTGLPAALEEPLVPRKFYIRNYRVRLFTFGARNVTLVSVTLSKRCEESIRRRLMRASSEKKRGSPSPCLR